MILATTLAVLGISVTLDRTPIVSSRSVLLTPTVAQGDYFRIAYRVEWDSSCTATGYRFVIDSARKTHIYDPDVRRISPGSADFEVSIQIPTDAALGVAEYRGSVEYRCNWFQNILPLEYVLETREFEIIPATEEEGDDAPVSLRMCPSERPVYVQPHCRALPGTLASFP